MSEQRKCRVSGLSYEVRDEDFAFYERVSPVFNEKKYQIPPPKLCPQERERLRLAYRNERTLYNRKSDKSGESMISIFHPDSPYTVYTQAEWWSDDWDPMAYGRNFDFSRSFFEQFKELQLATPRPGVINNGAENSKYCNFADQNKNCYLLTSANRNEDCQYGFLMLENKDAVDSLWVTNSEIMYECTDCSNCYNVRFANNCDNCSESSFISHCRGVKNCILCSNLTNVSYHILNKPCSKEDYDQTMQELSGSHEKYEEFKQKHIALLQEFPERRENNNFNSENILGNNVTNSQNIFYGFDILDSQDVAYSHDGVQGKDCHDVCFFDGTELCYASTSLIGYNYRFTIYCRDSYDLMYCDNCHNSKHLFGCVGLRNKEYCVFNMHYSKEEYEALVAKIIEHMQTTLMKNAHDHKEWGEFFPPELSPFAYNETIAQDYFPLTEETKGDFKWLDDSTQTASKNSDTIKIPDNIVNIPEEFCKQSLTCEDTGRQYRIIPQELEFYKKQLLPLPRKHPDRRLELRIDRRLPRRLYSSNCAECNKSILTPYQPDSYEKVYCTECYQKEFYA